jgi:hypothetical protein
MEKTCTKCLLTKNIEEFPLHKNYKGGRSTWCIACHNDQGRRWSKENPEKRNEKDKARNKRNPDKKRNSKLKQLYGITLIEFTDMSIKQNDKCLICGKHKLDNKNSKLFVDHCHKTGKIRGLICDRCNKCLGLMEDDIELLQGAIEYLKKNG